MKYLVTCLLFLPLITSCDVVQEDYYEQGYYNPPPGRVEVNPNYNSHGHYHGHSGYRPAQGGTVHGHPEAGQGAILNPNMPQVHGNAQQNIHGHNNNGNVHGHSSNGAVAVQPQPAAPQNNAQPKVHGHDDLSVNDVTPADGSVEVQSNVHGHN